MYGVFTHFTRFLLVLPSFTGFYQLMLSFTEFYRVLLGFTEFYRVLPYRNVPKNGLERISDLVSETMSRISGILKLKMTNLDSNVPSFTNFTTRFT